MLSETERTPTDERPSPLRDPYSPFHWNTGAWFGSQIGSTSFLLAGSLFIAAADRTTALIWMSCFIVVNLAGLMIWRSRARITAYRGFMLLLCAAGFASLVALYAADRRGQLARLAAAGGGNRNGVETYLALLVIPGLALRFYFMERAGQARRKTGENSEKTGISPLAADEKRRPL